MYVLPGDRAPGDVSGLRLRFSSGVCSFWGGLHIGVAVSGFMAPLMQGEANWVWFMYTSGRMAARLKFGYEGCVFFNLFL